MSLRSPQLSRFPFLATSLATSIILSLVFVCGAGISPLLRADDTDGATFSFIDLGEKTNQVLSEDFHGYPGNNLKPLPRGKQTFASIPFHVGDGMVQLAGKRAPTFPEEVTGVKVDLRCKRLHFLHGTGWGSPGVADGTKLGFYRVQYADGSEVEIPMVYGVDVRDWWQLGDSRGATQAEIGWTGMNEASRNFRNQQIRLRLFVRSWDNARPDVPISSFDFVSLNETQCAPFLIAVTCESSLSEHDAIEALRIHGVLIKTNDAGHAISATLSSGRTTRETLFLLTLLPQLREVDLSNNRLSTIASPLAKLTSVRVLILNFTDATDALVAQAAAIPGLKTLALHGTRVSDLSAAHLADSSLEVLDLSNTRITDRAVSHLSQIKDLRELDLRNTLVTEEAFKKLQDELSAEIKYP